VVEQKKVVKPKKFSCRQHIHYWLCDRLGIVCSDDFFDLLEGVDGFNAKWREYVVAQRAWNVVVAKKLHMDKPDDDEDRGMFN